MQPRIGLLTLGVRDLDAARRFYLDGLGWPAHPQSVGDVVFVDCAGLVLALFPRDQLAADAGVPAAGDGFRGFALAHNVADRASVDRVMAEAVRAGATIVKPAQPTFWGGYAGYFADPDGFLWEVAHNPAWSFDDAGRVVLPTTAGA